MDRWDSTTQAWTHIPYALGNPVMLIKKDSVDDAGSRWDGASVHAWSGPYGAYLTAKVARVFPQLFAGLTG